MVIIEFFTTAGYGILGPVFGIFVALSVPGGSAEVAGFAVAIYWAVKAIVQLPIARYLDRTKGEKDDYYIYVASHILYGLGMFAYLAVSTTVHIYLLQAFLGLAYAMYMASMYGLYSRHLDKNLESSEWSIYSVFSYSIATAIAGAVGGYIAVTYGFDVIFIGAGVLYFVGVLIDIFVLRPNLVPRGLFPHVRFRGLVKHDNDPHRQA